MAGLLLVWLFSLPKQLFTDPACMVLEDKDGTLLGARIAADGQWRFPAKEAVPAKFAQCLIMFEDKRFYYHPGVDPLGLARAMWQNLRSGKVVSGGSTISTQVIRLSRKGKKRTVFEKMVEIWLATRLELTYSKKEILTLYASHAPFGGNVVGLDAASWRYFGKQPENLTWAEAATLAVLPNSPALIHPGRNRQSLQAKRDQLLDRLVTAVKIDSTTGLLAKEEGLPDQPHALPRLAPHLLDRANTALSQKTGRTLTRLRTTVDATLQQRVNEIAERHLGVLRPNEINNMAILVLDVESGDVLAYVGNAPGTGAANGEDVDVIQAPRSTGSILKPLLYASALHDGRILPESMVSDVPTNFGGYVPENFRQTYDGAISIKRAVVRSLNVPLVQILKDYGLEKFHFQLSKLGLTTIDKPADHYGLTLVLGGAEGTLWDITGTYAALGRTLSHYPRQDGLYDPSDFRPANFEYGKAHQPAPRSKLLKEPPVLSAASIWFAFEAMKELERPNELGEWEVFRSSKPIAWKTGTSFGFRDAWAVGVTTRYAVGVWVGNADGEGRPGLVGVLTAAPLLFDVFDILPNSPWFAQPYDEMTLLPVCRQSGYRATELCLADSVWVPVAGTRAAACPFHQLVHLDPAGRWQVNSSCQEPGSMLHESWFVLPPVEEYYFKSKNPSYRPLPPFRADCATAGGSNPMQLIYPRETTKIYVPIDLDGKPGKTVFKVAHRKPETTIYWHLDNTYLGSTRDFHDFELNPTLGKHLLTLVDAMGNRLEQAFEIVSKERR